MSKTNYQLENIMDIDQQSKRRKPSTSKPLVGTAEWLVKPMNCIDGCLHDCKYCYAKSMAIMFGRKTPDNWKVENLRINDLIKKIGKVDGRIMFPSSHDITPEHLDSCIAVLNNILVAGNQVIIATKPHMVTVLELCDVLSEYKDQILFRFTIGSSDNKILKFWEPGAPCFEERLACLAYSYGKGFKTSVSCEPMLDFHVEKLIDMVLPFVTNSIWVGKMNGLLPKLLLNGANDPETLKKSKELVEWQSNDANILHLYELYKANPRFKWKENLKKVLNIEIPSLKGLDI
jgi:DNA repair photolyase